MPPRGVPLPRPRQRDRSSPVPFTTYSRDPNQRCHGSPSATAARWRDAARDAFDDMIDSLKSTLADLPSRDADPIWQSFLRWLDTETKSPTFDHTRSAPTISSEFHRISAESRSALEEAALLNNPKSLSNSIAKLIRLLMTKEGLYEAAPLGSNVSQMVADIANLRGVINEKEARLADLEHVPTPDINIPKDPFVAGTPFIPVPDNEADAPEAASRAYPETNWEDYAELANTSFTPIAKYSLEALAFRMAEPKHSKFLMPRALELYTLEEVNTALP